MTKGEEPLVKEFERAFAACKQAGYSLLVTELPSYLNTPHAFAACEQAGRLAMITTPTLVLPYP